MLKKKIWANLQRIIKLVTQKIVTKLSEIWVWDPGSGKKPILDPGSRGQKGTGSRIQDPDPQHWFKVCLILDRKGEEEVGTRIGVQNSTVLENHSEISCEKDKHFLSWWPWGAW